MATVTEMMPVEEAEFVEEGMPEAPAVEPDALYEIVDGVIVEKKVASKELWIANDLSDALKDVVRPSRLGRVFVEMWLQLDPDGRRKRRPDVAFVSADRWPIDRPIPDSESWWQMVPDLAVEVISPSELAVEMMAKMREYFDHGVRRVWLVFPAERWIYDYSSPTSVRIFAIVDEIGGGDLIPGFRMPLRTLFGDPANGVETSIS